MLSLEDLLELLVDELDTGDTHPPVERVCEGGGVGALESRVCWAAINCLSASLDCCRDRLAWRIDDTMRYSARTLTPRIISATAIKSMSSVMCLRYG